ncbi:SDR family NAD(P)-dependent oxidoreductase [uncultured Castellaniella sp.]|uniref:SDR family NAD(P)-dependent oxidoreductase n=1 Tax=uncultured Castellaniella sp. TaxID=647907 RepID=UPI002601781B|nr:SDR family NAD(P)-dependent oxidoreductase [uncultured Castellaniella sp.]
MADRRACVLVTGAAQGMGASHALALARSGWHVCLADVRDVASVVDAIRAEGRSASGHVLDVTDSDAWARLADQIARGPSPLAGLVNNAGVSYRQGIHGTDDANWRRVLDINLTGAFYGMRAMAPLMKEGGGGSIVNISSIAGQLGYHGAAYGASKWGLRGLTKSAAAEYAAWGIRANSIHPGLIETPMVSGATAFVASSLQSIPLSRAGKPSEVSAAVVFLISPDSSYLSGSELTVDGGLVAAGTYWRINHEAAARSVGGDL